MKKSRWISGLVLGLSAYLTACGTTDAEGSINSGAIIAESTGDETQGGVESSFIEREFWLALAEEPTWHLNLAREMYLEDNPRQASQELTKVAAILNFESRHCHSSREEGLLLASVQELREVARQLRPLAGRREGAIPVQEVDRVAALAVRSIAAHQVTLARDALEAGDGRMAGLYIKETALAIHRGFEFGGVPEGSAMEDDLNTARDVAIRMELDGSGSPEEGMRVLATLDSAVEGLSEVLTQRRR